MILRTGGVWPVITNQIETPLYWLEGNFLDLMNRTSSVDNAMVPKSGIGNLEYMENEQANGMDRNNIFFAFIVMIPIPQSLRNFNPCHPLDDQKT